jgi:hypothetical protein
VEGKPETAMFRVKAVFQSAFEFQLLQGATVVLEKIWAKPNCDTNKKQIARIIDKHFLILLVDIDF